MNRDKKIQEFKRVITSLSLTIVLMGFIACTEETTLESEYSSIVVSAFLYEGEPVNDVSITSTLPLGSQDTLAPPVSDANVVIIKGEAEFALSPDPERAGFYNYIGDDLIVDSEDVFKIRITYSGEQLSGETIVPLKPENVTISDVVLELPDMNNFDPRTGGFNPDDYQLVVSWDNPDGSLYYVVLDNLEEDPEPVSSSRFGGKFSRFISAPAPTSQYVINMSAVTHMGDHMAIVYKVNREYADLYESREQDSRNLNEPLTNIENGLGVFSAFASDTVYFKAILEN